MFFLHFFFVALEIVFGKAVAFRGLKKVECIAPSLAHAHAAIFRHIASSLCQFLASLASQFRYGDAEDATIDHRVEA